MIDSENLVWDTCVFSRFIIGDPTAFVDDIEAFISDARKGKRRIYFSSIVFAEIRQSAVKNGKEAELDKFFLDLGSAFVSIDVNPIISIFAGRLRAVNPRNPPPVQKTEKTRLLGTGDAIHLATAHFVKSHLGVSDAVFHTLDEGKGETWEGRCIPLLGFERHYPLDVRTKQVQAICDLPRQRPIYPQGRLELGSPSDAPSDSSRRH